jgi:hypothetical protein
VTGELRGAWDRYDERVRSALQRSTGKAAERGALRVLTSRSAALRELVEGLERGAEFKRLVAEVRTAFLPDGKHGRNESLWASALGNCLRRSHYYLDLSEEKTIRGDDVIDKLSVAFRRRSRQVTYLAPMEYLQLGCDSMTFKRFTIQRFKKVELDAMLQQAVNEVFYPWAYVKDVGMLTWYSMIVVRDTEPTERVGFLGVRLAEIGKIRVRYTSYPAIEPALQHLALVDWEAPWLNGIGHTPDEWEQWERFGIPFVMRFTDDLLSGPAHAPDLSTLTTEPNIDSYTGEYEGERPSISIHLDAEESESLRSYLGRIEDLLERVGPHSSAWPFFARAQGFLMKAFFTYELEQLLWHMAALEALLGENRAGVTERLTRRIGIIVGQTNAERRAIRKRFRELYSFRSHLVHGDEFGKQIWEGHLREARNLTRQVMVWSLHLLASIEGQVRPEEKPGGLPKREEILLLLDLERSTRTRVANLLTGVPAEFPHIASWIE